MTCEMQAVIWLLYSENADFGIAGLKNVPAGSFKYYGRKSWKQGMFVICLRKCGSAIIVIAYSIYLG